MRKQKNEKYMNLHIDSSITLFCTDLVAANAMLKIF